MVLEENVRVSCISLPALLGGKAPWREALDLLNDVFLHLDTHVKKTRAELGRKKPKAPLALYYQSG